MFTLTYYHCRCSQYYNCFHQFSTNMYFSTRLGIEFSVISFPLHGGNILLNLMVIAPLRPKLLFLPEVALRWHDARTATTAPPGTVRSVMCGEWWEGGKDRRLEDHMVTWLVVSTYPSEKCEFVSWDDFSFPTEWKVIKFHGSKPPTFITRLGP